MKEKIKQLKSRAAELAAIMKPLGDKLAAGTALTSDEQKSFDDTVTEFNKTEAEIKQLEAKVEAVEKQVSQVNAAFEKYNKPATPGLPPGPSGVKVGQDRNLLEPWGPTPAVGFGKFLIAVRNASIPGGTMDKRLHEMHATGMSEGIGQDGGFLVGKDMNAEIFRRAYETGIIVGKCQRIPISANSNGMKLLGVDESSRATGSRWGGIRGYWVAEAGTATKSAPKFRQIDLTLHKLMCLYYATDELLQDAAALGSVAQQGVSEEIGFMLDDSVINGSGAGQPLGILNSPSLVSVAKETGQSAKTVVAENIVNMYSRLWSRSRASAEWFINQDILPQLFTLSIAVGTGGAPIFVPAGGFSGKPFNTLLGLKINEIEQAQTLGTKGDIYLADFGQFLIADKGSVESESSIHVQFTTDEQVFKFRVRVDGQPLWNKALTPFKGTNTQSPFISLDTRA